MLSQFMDIEAVFVEVKRVLAPGGVFVFAEEPMKRLATLRLWRCPYEEQQTPWERTLYRWGLLPFLVRDVIGAGQEESFGIRQNHTMYLSDWHALVTKHFAAHEYSTFVPERGWLERGVKRAAVALDPHRSEWRAARLLGGTLAGFCRKEGRQAGESPKRKMPEAFETLLRCPDCGGAITRDAAEALRCASCGYEAALEGGVYNLIESADRKELYPGERADAIDMSLAGHEAQLTHGWHELEGVFGNRYRWIGARAGAKLTNLRGGPQRLRIRGFALAESIPVKLAILVNGAASERTIARPGLFVIEVPVADDPHLEIEIQASPVRREPGGGRDLSVNFGLLQLLPPAEF
jgi:predicted RNA-binding Zn-ribbon protein involved in translation (DUF1610 family)